MDEIVKQDAMRRKAELESRGKALLRDREEHLRAIESINAQISNLKALRCLCKGHTRTYSCCK